MHDIILKRLSSLHGLSSERELSNFLRGLRPTAKCLWRAYQANVVNVSYREETVQAAYMLRYFPHYAEVTRVALDELYRQGVVTITTKMREAEALDAFMMTASSRPGELFYAQSLCQSRVCGQAPLAPMIPRLSPRLQEPVPKEVAASA